MIRYPSKAKQTKARVFFAPAHALMKFLSLRTNLCNIYLLLSAPFPNMSMTVQLEGIEKSGVNVDANRLMMLVGLWCLWVGWWCRSVDDTGHGQLMMHVSWWCRLVGYAGWLKMMFSWWCWSFNDASQLMMPIGGWCWLFDDACQLIRPVSGCFW